MLRIGTTVVLFVLLAGCASDFRCPAKDGLGCVSIEEVYNKSSRSKNQKPDSAVANNVAGDNVSLPQRTLPGSPIRTDPRILRVYFAPWEDEHGNLHDESYTYMTLDTGRWILRANKAVEPGNAGIPALAPSKKPAAIPSEDRTAAGPAIIESPAAKPSSPEKLTLTPLPAP